MSDGPHHHSYREAAPPSSSHGSTLKLEAELRGESRRGRRRALALLAVGLVVLAALAAGGYRVAARASPSQRWQRAVASILFDQGAYDECSPDEGLAPCSIDRSLRASLLEATRDGGDERDFSPRLRVGHQKPGARWLELPMSGSLFRWLVDEGAMVTLLERPLPPLPAVSRKVAPGGRTYPPPPRQVTFSRVRRGRLGGVLVAHVFEIEQGANTLGNVHLFTEEALLVRGTDDPLTGPLLEQILARPASP